jgi:ABC-type bacteriocin/lantibiotic exporter with double-glycine peptidase domain
MTHAEFTNKLRQWDVKTNQWFFRHFYLLFFQVILVIAFVFFFVIAINIINVAPDVDRGTIVEKLLLSQSVSNLLIVFLLLLNSFWMLFMLASVFRVRAILKNLDFNLSRRQTDRRNAEDPF